MSGILLAVAHNYASVGIVLSPSNSNVSGFSDTTNVYAGVQFQTGGTEYKTPLTGGSGYTVSLGLWIDEGDPSDVWIQWTRTGGTLGDWNSADSGDTRLQLSSNRQWRIVRSSVGLSSIIGNFKFYDAASGGNLLHTTSNRTFSAEREPGG